MSKITTRFGFNSTAAEVVDGIDLSGKRVIVTGGASGIGIETSRAFASIGADVTLAVRNVEAAAPVLTDLVSSTGNTRVRAARLDLADRSTIARFCDEWEGPLHVLVSNAGIMALPELQRTPEGWEVQFATNYLGHFALATGLHAAMAAAGSARIVSLSSSGHLFSPIIFDDPHFNFVPYDAFVAYGQSKTATALFAVGATRKWAAEGITATRSCRARSPPTCSDTQAACERRWSGRKAHSRAPRLRSLRQQRPSLRGSGGDISKTATRRWSSSGEAPIIPASLPTRSAQPMPTGYGR